MEAVCSADPLEAARRVQYSQTHEQRAFSSLNREAKNMSLRWLHAGCPAKIWPRCLLWEKWLQLHSSAHNI